MLQNIHKRVKGWIAVVILAVVSFSFILLGVQYYLQFEEEGSKTIAKVNSEKITEKELTIAFQQMQRIYVSKLGLQLTNWQNETLKLYVLQNLIMDNVLLRSIQKAGFHMGSSQVNQFVAAFPAFQRNGQFSPERYREFLYVNSLTSDEFTTQMGNAFIVQQFADGIRNSAFVLPAEVKTNYELIHQTRDFRYMIIPSIRFLNAVKITKKMTADYYQKHCQAFQTPEKISITYLLLSPDSIRRQITISDREIKQYYENNQKAKPLNEMKDQIKRALIQQKVSDILSKKSDQLSTVTYANPTTLEPAARQLNLKIKTTQLFTHTGAQRGIASNPKIVAAAFSDDVLQRNNSDLIKLKDGSLVVLRVKQHELAHIPPLNTVTLQIEQRIRKKLAEKKSSLLAGKIQDMINQGRSLTTITDTNQLAWQIEKNVNRMDKTIPISILESAFSFPLTKEHSVTTTVLDNGDSALIQLDATKMAKFDEVSQKQRDALTKTLSIYWGNLDYQFYIQDAQSHAKIKIIKSLERL